MKQLEKSTMIVGRASIFICSGLSHLPLLVANHVANASIENTSSFDNYFPCKKKAADQL